MRLGDRYELGEVLGRGGMATVYRAVDTILDRPVAVKMLAARYAGDERFVERFRREAQASARLNHPNIVSVFDTGDQDGSHYIVMELVDGETLADVMRREAHLSPERSTRIASEVALALQAAHDQGIVHRDVKPGNVMITPSGDVKVVDFGIARAAEEDQLTQTGVVLGTAAYLSPEQSRGDPVDARSDVYSLGCVLREMLSGAPPFTGDTPVAIAYKHVHEPPTPPSSDDPRVPPELDAVVMRALEKDPARRYGSAAELGAALAGAAGGIPTEPIEAKGGDTAILPAVPPEEGPARRRWWPAVAALVVLAALAGGVAFVLTKEDRPRRADRAERRERREPSPPPETEPSFVEPEGIFASFEVLETTVSDAVVGGQMSREVGLRVLEEADKAGAEYRKGDVLKALEHLGTAHDRVDEGLRLGFATEAGASAVHEAIDAIAAAMQSSAPEVSEETVPEEEPPPEEEGSGGCESEGPGNSGCAPGHEDDEGDEDD